MDYTQTFEEFSRGLSRTDLALYAGVGIVLWVLFKDKLSPVGELVKKTLGSLQQKTSAVPKNPVPSLSDLTLVSTPSSTNNTKVDNDVFFRLVTSWKQTRDLAVQGGCSEAVKVADEMFPFLSPTVCKGDTNE